LNPAQHQAFVKAVELHKQQRYSEANHIYNRVLNGLPFEPNLLFCMADMYLRQDYNGLAANLLTNLLQENPNHSEAWCNLGICFRKENRNDQAKSCWERSLAIAGDSVEVCNNMAGLYADKCEPEQALEWVYRSLKIEPENHVALWHKSLACLTLGRYEEGWKLYGHRQKKDSWDARKSVQAPMWDGSPVDRLYIHGEQGVGDEIMFASAIPHMLHLAKDVTIEVHPKVAGIVKQTWPQFTVIKHEDGGSFDAKIPIGSLIGMFGTHPKPFLKPHPEKVAFYKRELERLGPGPYVALTWIGGTKETRAENRSFALDDLKPIMDRFTCVSAQYSHASIKGVLEAERNRCGLAKINDESAGDDLHDQAALFAAVDAVVTVQQTAVHVAGGVGAKTHALIGSHPHWRYGITGDRMPWYDSVKLHRQKTDWQEVIGRVLVELELAYH
jgi:hypothetical protein